MKTEETDAGDRMLSKMGEVFEGLYDQFVDFTHFVYALTGLYREPNEVALLISKQLLTMRGGADNAVWLLTDCQTIEETARNGKIVAEDKRRTLDWNAHSELKRAILTQRVVWGGPESNFSALLPDFDNPVIFPIKGATKALGFLVLRQRDHIDSEKYQHIALFASTILGMSDLFHRLDKETKKSRTLEISLREERDTAAMYLDVADIMLLGLDPEGNVELINRKGSQILGYPSEEIMGRNWFDSFVRDDAREQLKSVFHDVLASDAHGTKYVESRVVTRSGDERIIAWRINRVRNREGLTKGTLSSGDDVTDLRRVEQQKDALQSQLLQSQKMEAVGTLAAGIAHDFNNMLQVILGYADLLLREKKKRDSGQQELQRIIQTALDARDLVQRIRIFSKKADMQLAPVDLNRQIMELSSLLSRTILKTVAIDIRLAENLHMIRADRALVDQLVTNLAINSAEAMPNGGTLTIETHNATLDDIFCQSHAGARPGPHVLLTVSDTGRGIDKEFMERIFEPFFSTKQRDFRRGTGMGLAVVHGIVEQHNGCLAVESEVNKGTSFKIYFPALDAKEALKAPEKVGLSTGGSETILLVEDEEPVRELETRILEDSGYTVIAVGDGQQAVEVYAREQGNISLVILDIVMPRMDGKECIQELLKIDPSVRVLISSGVAQDDLVSDLVALGAKDSLLKPYSMKALLDAVRKILDGN